MIRTMVKRDRCAARGAMTIQILSGAPAVHSLDSRDCSLSQRASPAPTMQSICRLYGTLYKAPPLLYSVFYIFFVRRQQERRRGEKSFLSSIQSEEERKKKYFENIHKEQQEKKNSAGEKPGNWLAGEGRVEEASKAPAREEIAGISLADLSTEF
jgi:hypothetical protein